MFFQLKKIDPQRIKYLHITVTGRTRILRTVGDGGTKSTRPLIMPILDINGNYS